jgi:hypothetical protein
VLRIRNGDSNAMEDLYKIFATGMRYLLCRSLGPDDLEDKLHDCFLMVITAICNGDPGEPERLVGYVRTVVSRRIAMSMAPPFIGGATRSISTNRRSLLSAGIHGLRAIAADIPPDSFG